MISQEPPSSYIVYMDAHQLHLHHVRHEEHLAYLEAKARARHSSGVTVTSDSSYTPRHASPQLSGTLSCSGLEQLWISAGGNSSAAFLAAEIAKAESGGQQYATGAAGERGYWQINPDHGALSTYDPYGNARAAIIISYDGSNWNAWTTYTHGLYQGQC